MKNDQHMINPLHDFLKGEKPDRIIYAPNYWQWFTHYQEHNKLPEELKHCNTQLELINQLGLDVFSRNIYADPHEYWFGGLSTELFDGVSKSKNCYLDGSDQVIEKNYHTSKGLLTEKLTYIHNESTLVQSKFLVDDYESQLDMFEQFVTSRSWRFKPEAYQKIKEQVGEKGVVIAGELHSPLKMLHFTLGLEDTTFFLVFHEDRAKELIKIHESVQLDLLRQMLEGGVQVVMSMDNLDSMFHPPEHVEAYSASFYEKASALCHQYGSKFFIHACGQQKANLTLISSLGVDGLEGVAYPPLGNVDLDEAFSMVHDRFIITGGISAFETIDLKTREEVYQYVKNLFEQMKPFANRFILSASCNTAINTSWETLKYFRDAWLEYRDL